MIKTIIFDLGGVLIDLDMPGCFDRVKALGVDMDALTASSTSGGNGTGATICDGFTCVGAMHLYQIGKISTEEFLGSLQKLSAAGTTYQQVLDAWNSCLLTIPRYKLDFIKELRAKGYATHLLSNTNDAHWKFCMENSFPEPLDYYFDNIFVSQEMGLAKPDVNIYKEVLRQIDKPAEECLFIDDSKANCESAQAIGLNTLNIRVRTDYRETVKELLKQLS